MASFITRVELHAATAQDYATLHDAMKSRGFSTAIKGDDGILYELPTAMYVYYSDTLDASGVRQLARDAATQTGRNSIVFSADWNRASWNLGRAT